MYEERKDSFSFKSFFLTLLLVLLFVFLLLWIFPNKWDVKKLQSTSDIDRLSVLYDEIFANNIERMKDGAIGYFTNERLPQKVGEKKKLTLKEMYDLHLVLKLKDKNGNPCSETKSYVEMTKYSEEYQLKVNLSCGTQEDYIIVYLGCYSYCSSGICERRDTNNTPKPNYSCRIVDGKYYDKNGKVVNREEYNNVCTSSNNYSCRIVNGKYYDKNGNVVSETAYKNSCGETKYSCRVANGKYYDKNGNVVSESEFNKSCKNDEKYSCRIVNGKYYDKNGNVVSKTEYEKSCSSVKNYRYEYKKTTPSSTSCTNWSNWSKEKSSDKSGRTFETKEEKEIVKYTEKKVKVGEKKTTVTKDVTERYIKEYVTKLVEIGEVKVQVGTKKVTTTKEVYKGTVDTLVGIKSGTKVPQNTSTKKYVKLSGDTLNSCSTCTNKTLYYWYEYDIKPVYKTETVTENVPVYKIVKKYEEQKVPVYDFRTVKKDEVVVTPIYKTVKTPVYENIKYYRFKDCTNKPGTTDIKWSSSKNDTGLISKGYKFTGNVKEA